MVRSSPFFQSTAWLLALAAAQASSGCCSGTAVQEDAATTTRSVDAQGATVTSAGKSLAISRALGGATATGFSITFMVADTQINPVVIGCDGAALDGRSPGSYPLSALCTGGLTVGLACNADGCQTATLPPSAIPGTLTIVTNTGHGFADVTRVDGETAEFAAILDLPTTKSPASGTTPEVNVTLQHLAWKQHLIFLTQPSCGG